MSRTAFGITIWDLVEIVVMAVLKPPYQFMPPHSLVIHSESRQPCSSAASPDDRFAT